MIYFSELKNRKVYTEDLIFVGKLQDVIFLASEKPNITKIVIKPRAKQAPFVIPSHYIQKMNSVIIIDKEYEESSLADNELYIEKNLLDKQIIDITGSKIVRVNDVAIQNKPDLYLAGVDIGLLGILRWIKLEDPVMKLTHAMNIKLSSNFLSWGDIQPLELARGMVRMRTEQEKLERIRPEDLAHYLETTTTKNISKILNILDEKFAVDVIGSLNINYQHALFRNFSEEKAAKVITLIDPDEAVDILLTLSNKKRGNIIVLLPPDKRKKIQYLLHLAKTPIGDFITNEYITVKPENTVKDVINIIRKETVDFSTLYYIYVVNELDQLIGVFNLHELLMQNADMSVYKFMVQNVVVIHLTTPEEIAVNKMLKYNLNSLPVTDKDKKILGIVSIDDLTQYLKDKI